MNWWVNSMAPSLSRRVELAILEGDAEASSIDKIEQKKYSKLDQDKLLVQMFVHKIVDSI